VSDPTEQLVKLGSQVIADPCVQYTIEATLGAPAREAGGLARRQHPLSAMEAPSRDLHSCHGLPREPDPLNLNPDASGVVVTFIKDTDGEDVALRWHVRLPRSRTQAPRP
jgi:hypothetical protein